MPRDSRVLVSAALRHVRDAEHLLRPHDGYTSPDQAYHLAGFGPECARKATLTVDWFDKAIGHRFEMQAETVLDVAIALDARAARYAVSSWAQRYPNLAKWTEVARCEPTGTRLASAARALVEEARACVDEVVLALWLDGRLDGAWT